MTGGVTVHAIFWAPPGYSFPGAPPGSKSTEGLLEQYFNDVRVAGTGTAGQPCTTAACNVFTVEPQYGWGTTPGGVTPGQNTINFSTATDVVHDTDPYPNGCSSPQDTKACVTDAQVQSEVDKIVQGTPGKPRGLSNIWYVFFPPNVDECISQGVC